MENQTNFKNEKKTPILGNLTIKSNWTLSEGRPLQEGEHQFFHSTYAYNITPEQYRQIVDEEEFILDRRIFVETNPKLGYGMVPNAEYRKYKENPDELILLRIITKDLEPFKKIQLKGSDIGNLQEGETGGPETRFDPRFLGYNLKLKKVGEERLEQYPFPNRVVTYEIAEKIPIGNNQQ